jgi:hypothetical protein
MKNAFFTFLALSVPLLILGALIYMFVRGLYTILSDWWLDRELKQLRLEAIRRRSEAPDVVQEDGRSPADRVLNPPTVEPPGIFTVPLESAPRRTDSASLPPDAFSSSAD